MNKKMNVMVVGLLILALIFGNVAMAFQDIPEGIERDKIMQLKEDDIVQGIDDDLFAPQAHLTYAQTVQLIVTGFDLNIDHMRFIKLPLASDHYENVADDAWYAQAFINAHYNGIEIVKDVDPTRNITREEYAHLLFSAMRSKSDFVFIEIWLTMDDEDEVSTEYMNSIQKMLI